MCFLNQYNDIKTAHPECFCEATLLRSKNVSKDRFYPNHLVALSKKKFSLIVLFISLLIPLRINSMSNPQTDGQAAREWQIFYEQFDEMMKESDAVIEQLRQREQRMKHYVCMALPYGLASVNNVSKELWDYSGKPPRSQLVHAALEPVVRGLIIEGTPLMLERAGIKISDKHPVLRAIGTYSLTSVANVTNEVWVHGGKPPQSHLAHAALEPIATGLITDGALRALKRAGVNITCPEIVRDIHPDACEVAAQASRAAVVVAVSKCIVTPLLIGLCGEPH